MDHMDIAGNNSFRNQAERCGEVSNPARESGTEDTSRVLNINGPEIPIYTGIT